MILGEKFNLMQRIDWSHVSWTINYNYIMTDPRKILLCSLCNTLASSVEEGNLVSCTVQVSKENEGDILGYPSKKIILGQSVWDIKHLNDRMHGITYIWQSQAPVSINSCLTIEGLLKKCISEEVPCGFFLRTVIVNRENSCELKAEKNVLVLRQWADLFQFSKFRNVQTQNNILKFLLLLANVGC